MSKFITATVFATLFASTAIAQTSTGSDTVGSDPTAPAGTESMAPTPDWDQEIVDAFYEDPAASLVRSEADIKERWEQLDEQAQTQVRDDCATFTADAGGSATMPSGSESGTDTAATGSDTATEPMAGSDSSAMAESEASGAIEGEASGSTTAETETPESGTSEMDTAAGSTIDTESTTGSTSTDTAGSASGTASGGDVELQAASVQIVCTTVEGL